MSESEKEREAETDYPELDIGTLDPNFKYEIAQIPGGENILYCFQCGTCSAV